MEVPAVILEENSLNKKAEHMKRVAHDSRLKKYLGSDRRLHLTEYTVKRNENLWLIAKRTGIKPELLAEINNIKNP